MQIKALVVILCFCFLSTQAFGVRIKDIAYIKSGRANQLIGYSLVIGLNGTGDSPNSLAARGPLIDALTRLGVVLTPNDIVGRSVAAVMVTATLPPFAKAGNKIDVLVSSIGDTLSLHGGVLLMSPLRGANREIYAVAQGQLMDVPKGLESPAALEFTGNQPLEVDPYRNYTPTVARIIEGASIEKEIDHSLNFRTHLYLSLNKPDFTTAYRISNAINQEFHNNIAKAEDAGTIELSIPPSYLSQSVELISRIEKIEINDDQLAKVVIDERSGTVIIGENVTISPVAIALNDISLLIREEGVFPKTAYTPKQLADEKKLEFDEQNQAEADAEVKDPSVLPVPEQEKNYALLYNGGVYLKEIVDGLNRIGVTNRELIDIIKNLKTAGALSAELVIK